MKLEIILEQMWQKVQASDDIRSLNVLLEGDPSTGKSFKCEQFAKKKGVAFVSLSMPTLLIEHASGIPYRQGDTVMNSCPTWLTELGKNGILLLDEFNAADDDTQKLFLSLLSERRINNNVLGAKVMIVAAQNNFLQVGNYKMSTAVLSRFAKYHVGFDYQDWRKNYLPGKLNNFALSVLDNMMKEGLRFSEGQDFVKEDITTTARSIERWLVGASAENIDFLIEDSAANLSMQGTVVARQVLQQLKDDKNRANEIFSATESSEYDIRLSTAKKRKKIIYEI